MAIGKWISFGTSQSATAPVPVVVEQRPIIPAADAKLFGLENVSLAHLLASIFRSFFVVWQHLVSVAYPPHLSFDFLPVFSCVVELAYQTLRGVLKLGPAEELLLGAS